jgi:hypothetical protein
MITSIMQPTFIPSAIYFSLILQSDNFVFLDNVQFSKQSWQQRNIILTSNGPKWITLPFDKKNTLISNTKIKISDNLVKKNLTTIKENYSKTKFFKNYFPELEKIFNEKDQNLMSFNVKIIKWMCKCFEIKSNFYIASEITNNNNRIDRLLKICSKLKTSTYLSPLGAKEYLSDNESFFGEKKIKVKYNDFDNQNFLVDGKILSALHYLFIKGPKTVSMIKKSIIK